MTESDDQPPETGLGEKIKTLMTEIRVILPGAQALLGFQFTGSLSQGFEKLPERAKLVHLAALAAVALATILLMAPAAYHRIAAGGEDRPDVEEVGDLLMLGALVPLAAGLCAEFYVVADKIGYSERVGLIGAALAFLAFLGLWFAYPLVRSRVRQGAGQGQRAGNESRQQL